MTNSEVVQALQTGYRMPKPRDCSNELYKLMMRCWQDHDIDRPSFEEIQVGLNSSVQLGDQNMNEINYLPFGAMEHAFRLHQYTRLFTIYVNQRNDFPGRTMMRPAMFVKSVRYTFAISVDL